MGFGVKKKKKKKKPFKSWLCYSLLCNLGESFAYLNLDHLVCKIDIAIVSMRPLKPFVVLRHRRLQQMLTQRQQIQILIGLKIDIETMIEAVGRSWDICVKHIPHPKEPLLRLKRSLLFWRASQPLPDVQIFMRNLLSCKHLELIKKKKRLYIFHPSPLCQIKTNKTEHVHGPAIAVRLPVWNLCFSYFKPVV